MVSSPLPPSEGDASAFVIPGCQRQKKTPNRVCPRHAPSGSLSDPVTRPGRRPGGFPVLPSRPLQCHRGINSVFLSAGSGRARDRAVGRRAEVPGDSGPRSRARSVWPGRVLGAASHDGPARGPPGPQSSVSGWTPRMACSSSGVKPSRFCRSHTKRYT